MTVARDLGYVLPLKAAEPDPALAAYIHDLVDLVGEVVVVDASPPGVAAVHRLWWPTAAVVVAVDGDLRCANGKVAGVLTGLRRTGRQHVVIADDDVRHDEATLDALAARLADADAVVPANPFDPLPWHARWDTGRILLNRALGHDYPGTIAVRRAALEATGGYDGDVLFENRELIETVRAAGGVVRHAPQILVRRVPPTAAHFGGQRVRQAYDSLSQPPRLVVELALLPVVVTAVRRRGWGALAAATLATVALAERGRRRDGGTAAFPATSAAWAPLWVAERAICAWLALAARLRGGVRYGDRRLRRAATPRRELRRRHAGVRGPGGRARTRGAPAGARASAAA